MDGFDKEAQPASRVPNRSKTPDGLDDTGINYFDERKDLPTMTSYPLQRTLQGHDDAVPSVRFSPNSGTLLASASADGFVRVWNVETGAVVNALRSSPSNSSYKGVSDVAWGRRGTFLASACDDNTIRIWDPKSGTLVRVLKGHTHHVTSVCISPGDDILASCSFDETVRLWDMHSGRPIGVIPAHSDPVITVDFSDNITEPLLLSASTDGIW